MTLALCCLLMLPTADPLQVELQRSADRAAQETNDGRVTLYISSKSGIGSAILRPNDQWPKGLAVELNLRGLEGLALTQGDFRLRTWLGNEKPEASRQIDGAWRPARPGDDEIPSIERLLKGIRITVPAAWLKKDAPELKIEWIDFYRG